MESGKHFFWTNFFPKDLADFSCLLVCSSWPNMSIFWSADRPNTRIFGLATGLTQNSGVVLANRFKKRPISEPVRERGASFWIRSVFPSRTSKVHKTPQIRENHRFCEKCLFFSLKGKALITNQTFLVGELWAGGPSKFPRGHKEIAGLGAQVEASRRSWEGAPAAHRIRKPGQSAQAESTQDVFDKNFGFDLKEQLLKNDARPLLTPSFVYFSWRFLELSEKGEAFLLTAGAFCL